MDSGFKEIHNSDTPLYGPKMILFAGFPGLLHPKLHELLKGASLGTVSRAFLSQEHLDRELGDLFALPDRTGEGEASNLPRAILVAGISQGELKALMAHSKRAGMRPPLWAVLTPTSVTWPLKELLGELAKEREALLAWERTRTPTKRDTYANY